MALKVKAVERLLKFDKNDPGSYRYVLKPELYTSLDQKKVIREAALRSGVSQGVFLVKNRSKNLFVQKKVVSLHTIWPPTLPIGTAHPGRSSSFLNLMLWWHSTKFYSKNLKYSLKYLQLSEIIPIFAASNVCLTIRVESREGKTSPTLPIYKAAF